MGKSATKFYNMLVHLIKNNRLFEENVAIKNVWRKEGNIFLDIYFYRNRKSYIFDALFVHDILDLTNEKYYQNIEDFVIDFLQEDVAETEPEEAPLTIDKSIFQPIYVGLVIMSFIARCCGNYNIVKKRIIFEYIQKHLPSTANLSRQYIETYIEGLKPTENEFYQALKDINFKSQEAVENLSRELMKICLADGRLMYLEKMYMAELLQLLRDSGCRVDLGL